MAILGKEKEYRLCSGWMYFWKKGVIMITWVQFGASYIVKQVRHSKTSSCGVCLCLTTASFLCPYADRGVNMGCVHVTGYKAVTGNSPGRP